MIINCPECSTGFQLPDERVTPKGTKLKCSRCKHVFRVRSDEKGEPEIFYRDGDNEDTKGKKKKASKGSSPFPHAGGLNLKPKKKSAFGSVGDSGEEEEEEAAELDEVVEEPAEAGESSATAGATASASEGSDGSLEEESVPGLTGNSASAFGDPADHVDPSFGTDGPSFDPKSGKKVGGAPPKKARRGPPAAAGGAPPPTAAAAAGPPNTNIGGPAAAPEATQAASKPEPAGSPADWDDDDLAPHNIGGGAGKKVLVFLLLVCIVAIGFVGVVASLNDGFIDFKAFPEMIEVAFADGEYEPREEWGNMGPSVTIVGPENPVEVESVHGELISLGRGEQIFVVQGMVRNHEDSRASDVELRAMITTPEGRSLSEIVGAAGDDVPISEFRSLGSGDDAGDLLNAAGVTIDSGAAVPFTMVFSDPPQRVVDGERFTFRVETVE